MPQDESLEIDIALPPVDPHALYEAANLDHDEIPRAPIGDAFGRAGRALAAAARWARRQLATGLVALLVFGVVAELAARSLEPRLVGRVYDAWNTAGHPIARNAAGYRGPLVPPRRDGDGDATRVLALGDSVTFGTGVAFDATWPFALGDRLAEQTQAPTEILNLSGPLAEVRQLTALLERYGRSHDPDVAVLMLTGNMISLGLIREDEGARPLLAPPPPRMPPGLLDRLTGAWHAFALPGLLTIGMEHLRLAIGLNDHLIDPEAPFGVMLAHGIRQANLDPALAQRAYTRLEQDLRTLRERAADVGVPLVVAYAPPRFALSSGLLDNPKSVPTERFTIDPLERTRAICERLGLPFVPLAPALRAAAEAPAPIYVLSDYAHLDRAGHAAAADALLAPVRRALRPER